MLHGNCCFVLCMAQKQDGKWHETELLGQVQMNSWFEQEYGLVPVLPGDEELMHALRWDGGCV